MSERSERTKHPSLGEFVFNEAHHAIHDVRQKLFEEAWFGRVVTAEPVMEVSRDDIADRLHRVSLDELWGRVLDNHEQPEHKAPDLDR
jgi:hypothetical protein